MKKNRYARQINLPEIGPAGQERLFRASVLCVGAGGLGCPALLYLAAAGVGRIGIMDFDRVDESNLQRQIIYTTKDIGHPKATSAATRLRALNPDIHIRAYDERLTAGNVESVFREYDIILDGTDHFEAKFLINDAAVKYGKTVVYGAIQGFDGQVSVFNAPLSDTQRGPCYRCLYPEMPKATIMNCADGGVIGAVAGLIGMTQALQVIQLVVGDKTGLAPLIGKIWTLDTHTMHSQILQIRKKKACSVCGVPAGQIMLSDHQTPCLLVPEISATQLDAMKGHTLIDVREQGEWDNGHLETAQFWPLSQMLAGRFPPIEKNEKTILYCQRGQRSLQAGHMMVTAGFNAVYSLAGGYEALMEQSPQKKDWSGIRVK